MILQHRFLFWDSETHQFYLLGYHLSLTPKEKEILLALMESRANDADPLSIQALTSNPNITASAASIPVHVCAINKKAFAISGRKPIVFSDGGYSLIAAL